MIRYDDLYLFDLENVHKKVVIKYLRRYAEGKFVIFYSSKQHNEVSDIMEEYRVTLGFRKDLEFVFCNNGEHDAMDFILVTYLAKAMNDMGYGTIHIVSKDSGYDAVIKALNGSNVTVCRECSESGGQVLCQNKVGYHYKNPELNKLRYEYKSARRELLMLEDTKITNLYIELSKADYALGVLRDEGKGYARFNTYKTIGILDKMNSYFRHTTNLSREQSLNAMEMIALCQVKRTELQSGVTEYDVLKEVLNKLDSMFEAFDENTYGIDGYEEYIVESEDMNMAFASKVEVDTEKVEEKGVTIEDGLADEEEYEKYEAVDDEEFEEILSEEDDDRFDDEDECDYDYDYDGYEDLDTEEEDDYVGLETEDMNIDTEEEEEYRDAVEEMLDEMTEQREEQESKQMDKRVKAMGYVVTLNSLQKANERLGEVCGNMSDVAVYQNSYRVSTCDKVSHALNEVLKYIDILKSPEEDGYFYQVAGDKASGVLLEATERVRSSLQRVESMRREILPLDTNAFDTWVQDINETVLTVRRFIAATSFRNKVNKDLGTPKTETNYAFRSALASLRDSINDYLVQDDSIEKVDKAIKGVLTQEGKKDAQLESLVDTEDYTDEEIIAEWKPDESEENDCSGCPQEEGSWECHDCPLNTNKTSDCEDIFGNAVGDELPFGDDTFWKPMGRIPEANEITLKGVDGFLTVVKIACEYETGTHMEVELIPVDEETSEDSGKVRVVYWH
jgi:hypothetical protein